MVAASGGRFARDLSGMPTKLGDIVRGPTGNASAGSDLATGRETLAESVGSSKIRAVRLDVNLGSEHCVCRLLAGWPAADRRAAYFLVELVPFSRKCGRGRPIRRMLTGMTGPFRYDA